MPENFDAENRPAGIARRAGAGLHAKPIGAPRQPQIGPPAIQNTSLGFAAPDPDRAVGGAPAQPTLLQPPKQAPFARRRNRRRARRQPIERDRGHLDVGVAEVKEAKFETALVLAFEAVLGGDLEIERHRPARQLDRGEVAPQLLEAGEHDDLDAEHRLRRQLRRAAAAAEGQTILPLRQMQVWSV